ncbi:MAG TPA: Crp/Fnr family transcriptional regulator [Rhizomicrobium sp.]|nr:Crp/Fnr family transcriptional regulator [Rhizomicrobium sp.]
MSGIKTDFNRSGTGLRSARGTAIDNALVKKLEGYVALDAEDKRLLNSIIQEPRTVPARVDLAAEGDKPVFVHLILDGFACRYKSTAEGSRQIMAYLLPGDFCDMHVFVLKQMDHSIATISPCTVVDIPREQILKLLERPRLSLALWCAALVDAAVLREWLLNVGQRHAAQRLAHVLCELLLRLRIVGLADKSCELPLSQTDLADTIGTSTVHLNRVLQELRRAKLITWKGDTLAILDIDKLMKFSGFNPNYLHIGMDGADEAAL